MPSGSDRFYIIGAGAVGLGLAKALRDCGYTLVGLWNRGQERRKQAEAVLGQAFTADLGAHIGQANLVLVCVADNAIAEVGAKLAVSGSVAAGTTVAHTSGCLPASALAKIPGAVLGSLHPLVACTDPEQASLALRGATYAVEGDARTRLAEVAKALGGRVVAVDAVQKARYHAAAVLASNLMVALLDLGAAEAAAVGLQEAITPLGELAIGAVRRAMALGPAKGLTGPVRRGDADTVRAHLETLGPEALPVYRALSLRAVRLARQAGLTEAGQKALVDLLTDSQKSDD